MHFHGEVAVHSDFNGQRKRPSTWRTSASALALGLVLVLVLVLAACAGSSDAEPETSVDGFVPSAGSEIPTVDLKFGMKPFPDSTFYVIAMNRGYFDDVGLNIEPKPFGTAVTPDNVVSLLKNGAVDIATINGPSMVKFMSQVPDLRMFGFADTYEATYLLASPNSGVTSAGDRIDDGVDPAKAIEETMAEVEGKGVAINNTGSQRVFINTIFEAGGLTFDDVDLTVTDDAKIVQLATGGEIEFATPDGSGQNVQLLKLGWYPAVSVNDLAQAPGNEAVVSASLSHEGPAALDSFMEKNTETALRFLSVMFRTIDDIEEDPDSALPDQLPYLESRSGVDLGVDGLKQVYEVIDPLTPFEEQPKYWDESLKDPTYFETVYSEQIKAAQSGGILPAGDSLEPSSNIVGGKYYQILMDLKEGYDDLLTDVDELTGDSAELAADAAKQYEWHNYLDAYRLLKAASGS